MKMKKNLYISPEVKLFTISVEGRFCGLSDNDQFNVVSGGSLDD